VTIDVLADLTEDKFQSLSMWKETSVMHWCQILHVAYAEIKDDLHVNKLAHLNDKQAVSLNRARQ